VNDGGGGESCGGRTDTTKLSNMVIADFGDGRNLSENVRSSKVQPRLRAE